MQKNEKNALRFGLAGGPLQAIRVLAKRLTGGYWRGDAWAVVVVEPTGTYTAANIYPGSGFGPRYNPVHYRHPVKDGLIAKKLAQGYQDVTAELPETRTSLPSSRRRSGNTSSWSSRSPRTSPRPRPKRRPRPELDRAERGGESNPSPLRAYHGMSERFNPRVYWTRNILSDTRNISPRTMV